MASFGSFETGREVYSDSLYTVYNARKRGDAETEYAVKVFRLPAKGAKDGWASEPGKRDELEREYLSRISVQQQGAEASPLVAPVLERGQDDRGIWYVTRFYPRSVNKMMSGKVALPRASLEHIVGSIAQGALELKRACGRGHGDIRLTNVQVGKGEKLTEAEVVLSDPKPGSGEEAQDYEINDLHAIGEILLQLVRQRVLNNDDIAVLVPIAPSAEWTRVFGKDAGEWLSLCNRLLDANLSAEQFRLEDLAAKLEQLRPKRGGSRKLVMAGAVALVTIGAVGLWWWRPRLEPAQITYGSVAIKSEPGGATILKDGVTMGITRMDGSPFIISNVAPGVVKYQLKLAQYEPADVRGVVSKLQTLDLATTLHRSEMAKAASVARVPTQPAEPALPVSNGAVELKTEPGAALIIDADGKVVGPASADRPLMRSLAPGKYVFTARTEGLDDVVETLTVESEVTNQHEFVFDYGTVVWGTEPVAATVSMGGLSRDTPATFVQKPGVAKGYVIAAAGYVSVTNVVTVKKGEVKYMPTTQWQPQSMPVELVSDPPGAVFLGENGAALEGSEANKPIYYLPWGPTNLVARHPKLGSITNHVVLTRDGGAAKISFKFDYGTLVLTNLPLEVAVYEREEKVGSAADKWVYQRTGGHAYTLRDGAGPQDLQMNISAGLNFLLWIKGGKAWTNGLGMSFAWVPDLPGGGAWPGESGPGGWVGIMEVTQGQYKKMDGSNPSAYREGGNYPVENLTWDQAMSFCGWLSSADTAPRLGWHYALPTDEQFAFFAGDADRAGRITSIGRTSKPADDRFSLQRGPNIPAAANLNTARTHPEMVASTRQPNEYGLYDVAGNVWEWIGRSNGKENVYAGGSYLGSDARTAGTKARERGLEKGPAIGFRVILIPAQ